VQAVGLLERMRSAQLAHELRALFLQTLAFVSVRGCVGGISTGEQQIHGEWQQNVTHATSIPGRRWQLIRFGAWKSSQVRHVARPDSVGVMLHAVA
jgi:hypothetical protein